MTEAFLRFSPLVQWREPNFLFLDIASTSRFFVSQARTPDTPESGVLSAAVALAAELGFTARAAISDTAAGAQAFAQLDGGAPGSARTAQEAGFICPPGEEKERLQALSLPLLLHLEGLCPWPRPREIEQIVTFFMMIGIERIADLQRFNLASFQERWGQTGALLWRRLRGLDQQVISPFLPTEPLEEYKHLDFPVSLASLLLHEVRRSLQFLFARLHGRRLYARRLTLRLHCEYSEARHKIEIEPNSPCRDLGLFLTLLENKLEGVDLENPIRDFEIEVLPCPERVQQLDFFEPRSTDRDRLETLISLLTQSSLRTGRYAIQDAILPERSWRMHTGVEAPQTEYDAGLRALNHAANQAMGHAPSRSLSGETGTQEAYQLLPRYGAPVMSAPRPTRLLRKPRRIPLEDMRRLHLLTARPVERLENAWWDGGGERREYYFAVSSTGQGLWIFKDLEEQEYYLHGYFD